MSLSRRQKLSAALVVVSLAGAGSALGAPIRGDDLVACRNKGQVALRKDGWLKIMAPPVTSDEGPREIVDMAAPPNTPKILYATNGALIKNSVDGGCEWSILTNGLEPPNAPNQPADPAQPDVFTHLLALTPDVLWAAGYDDIGGVPRPHVYLYEDLDLEEPTPSRVENGLPPVGRPIELVGTRQGSPVIYLLVEEPPDPRAGSVDATHHLYVTVLPDDPQQLSVVGTIWREVPAPEAFGRIDGLALGPGGRLWIWSDSHFAVTPDAKADELTWTTHPSPGGKVVAIDVDNAGEALVAGERGTLYVDQDGNVVGEADLPVGPTSMTHGRTKRVRVLSGKDGTWGYDQRARRWVDITPAGAGALRNLTMAQGMVERILLGHTTDAIYRYDTYAGETFIPRGSDLLGGDWPDLPHSDFTEPYLDVRPDVVTVRPGEVKDVDVEYGHPPTVHPLDVFFVVDTTGSMQSPIDGLKKDIYRIASDLKDRLGEHACFGLGDFKDASNSPNDVGKVYRTHQKIACETDPKLPLMATALEELEANGGGTEPPEAQTIALTQMVTGEGSVRPLVLPDQDAEFRDEAYKVAVLISDVKFKQGTTSDGYYPTIDETAKRLRVNGIKVVSVLTTTNNEIEPAHADMAELAELTDSLAPPGGVDCDGDGEMTQYDVTSDAPLICEVSGSDPNIGPVIISLLLGVPDPGTLTVQIDDPDDVVGNPVKGVTSRLMNLKRPAVLEFTVPATCTPAQDGKDLIATFHPTARARPVDLVGHLLVRCRSVPVVPPVRQPKPPEPPIFEKPIVRHVVAAGLLPPANPPAQPISNINLNAGFSSQEEQEYQLATVTQGANEAADEESIELAMVGQERRERATPAGAFIAATMTLTASAAVALRRRTQYRVARR